MEKQDKERLLFLTKKRDNLSAEVSALDAQIREIIKKEQELVIFRATHKFDFTDNEIIYSANSRCLCGAGLAYPKGIGPTGFWDCSDILTGRMLDKPATQHKDRLPFMFWKIKEEHEKRGSTRPGVKESVS